MDITFSVNNQKLRRTDAQPIVASSINYLYAHFDFTEDWDGTAKTALFSSPSYPQTFAVLLDEWDDCLVPVEVLANEGRFTISVFCTGEEQRITTNSVACNVTASGYVANAATPSVPDPTPTIYEQVLAIMQETEAIAQGLRDDAASGMFDGADGRDGVDGADGQDGRDGIDGAKGDKGDKGDKGEDGTNGVDGINGIDGQDGISPTATVTPISGGNRLSITDRDGTHSIDIMHGQDGADGQDGQDGQDGADADVFLVKATYNNQTYTFTTNKTFAQAEAAALAGKTVLVSLEGCNGDARATPFQYYTNEEAFIGSVAFWNYDDGEVELMSVCWSNASSFDGNDSIRHRFMPGVNSSDNGKFLRVVDGYWQAVAVPVAEEVSF